MFGRIANILGWAGIALVLAGVATWIYDGQRVQLRQGFAIAGLVCILVYVASQWREMAATLSKRNARYGALSAASVVIVLGLIAGINYLGERYNKRWDLTASREFTLSDQTRRVIAGLKEPLRILVFGVAEDMQPFRDRLAEYADLSDQLKVEYIDLNKDPALARQYQVQARGTIVVEYQKRVERVTSTTNEQDITNAIVKAVQGQQRKIYFVTGHGEKDPTSSEDRAGYNAANAQLQRDNFTVEKVALAQQAEVPADAAAIVIAGPERDYLPPEIDALRRYLNKGGKALVMLDPPATTDAPPLTNLVALVAEWGFQVGDNVVVDQSSIGQAVGRGPGAPVVISYPGHPITERFRYMTMFPLTRSVAPATGGARTAQPLFESSAQSWAESDVKALAERRPVSFDGSDTRGPVGLGAAMATPAPDAPATPPAPASAAGQPAPEPPKRPETRIVVIGDSDFAANEAIGFEGNSDLFVNTMNWLAEQENLIAIRPKAPDDRRVTMTEDRISMVAWLALLLIPGAVFTLGGLTWWRRRG
jgi:ABC-type uncharacterized transport system involved in gliding motility auxiliary subunit